MLNDAVKNYLSKSVLCWLATANKSGEPNVSPKEVFTYEGDQILLIANIASPVSVGNIRENPMVCVSFVDVFIQKGYKIKGEARILEKKDPDYEHKEKHLTDLFSSDFPIKSIIEVTVQKVATIQAPSYFLNPQVTEQTQIKNAMKTYGVRPEDVNQKLN